MGEIVVGLIAYMAGILVGVTIVAVPRLHFRRMKKLWEMIDG